MATLLWYCWNDQTTIPLQEDTDILGQGNKRYRLDTHWSQADVAKYP